MGAQDNGLTLEGLAQKLETQTKRLETLEHENTELRSKVATLEGLGTHRSEVAAPRGSDTHQSGDGQPAAQDDYPNDYIEPDADYQEVSYPNGNVFINNWR